MRASHVIRIPSSNQDMDFRIWFRDEKTRLSDTNCIMKLSFLKCSKNRTCRSWRKLLIWTWSWKIKFSHFVKLLFSQQIIQNKNFDPTAVFLAVYFQKLGWTGTKISWLGIKDFYGKFNFMLQITSTSQSELLRYINFQKRTFYCYQIFDFDIRKPKYNKLYNLGLIRSASNYYKMHVLERNKLY